MGFYGFIRVPFSPVSNIFATHVGEAIESLLASRVSFAGLAEATRRRRCALQAVGLLLQLPHTYQVRQAQGATEVNRVSGESGESVVTMCNQ